MPPQTNPPPPIPNSYWIIPGRFAAGKSPSVLHQYETLANVHLLLTAGIDHTIDLTMPDELLHYETQMAKEAQRLNLQFEHESHPIQDLSTPRTPDQMKKILDAIDQALTSGKNVYLHCHAGLGRTGATVGCWLVRKGATGEQALQQIKKWNPYSPQTEEQHQYVRNWREKPSNTGKPPTNPS